MLMPLFSRELYTYSYNNTLYTARVPLSMTNAPLSLEKGKFLPILMPNGGDWQVMILVVKMSD